MKVDKVKRVINYYESTLTKLGFRPEEANYNNKLILPSVHMNHILSMLPKMKLFLKENRVEKTMRWLGFVQGVLYSQGLYSIDNLRHHNMPKGDI